ncbi:MAG: c-type cytochrome [Verrucomicrobia bacterium]|nr:c-type cytochrome [Verrucomicrobiota bacterium]
MRLHLFPAQRLNDFITALMLAAAIKAQAAALHSTDPSNFEIHPALEINLFVQEPDVVDPVAMTFDADGRIYAVEMRDYPLGIGPEHRPGGTVRLLEDTDGDGKIDRSTVFAENLRFPTSIAPWNGGVLVTAPPDILFLKDTDGDGRADVREVVLTGFTVGVTDSNVNGLRWGLDNRLHGLNGGNSGTITSPKKPGISTPLRNCDFSFDPATGDFALTYHTSGGFGLVFDDWGHSFVTYNINHIQQRIIPVRYLERFPGMPPVEATVSISDHEDMARIYPISTAETRPNHPEQAGRFSSAGGLGYISRGILGGVLLESVLVCDVVGNLVHRDVLQEAGPIFSATRAPEEAKREFLASRDNAFRPVGLETGPDGALYLLDMQRDVIEHPDYIPDKVKAKIDLRAGEDRGRIYRITPKGGLPFRKPNLSKATSTQLVNELSNSNQWWRVTAQRLLVERKDRSAVRPLRRLAKDESHPLGQVHALWTLAAFDSLKQAIIHGSLRSPYPGLRESALVLAEKFLKSESTLRKTVFNFPSDPIPRVRLQAALSFGEIPHPTILNVAIQPMSFVTKTTEIFRRDETSRWIRLAVLSSIQHTGFGPFGFYCFDPRHPINTPEKLEAVHELAQLFGARADAFTDFGKWGMLRAPLQALSRKRLTDQARLAVIEGLADGVGRAVGKDVADATIGDEINRLAAIGSPDLVAATLNLTRALRLPFGTAQQRALAEAVAFASDSSQSETNRLANVQLLALGSFATVKSALFSLLEGAQPVALQQAALVALRQFTEPEVAQTLVARWRQLSPGVRPQAIDLLLHRRDFHSFLVEAVETEKIKVGELNLDLEQRRQLLRESSPEIQARAAKFFGDEEYSNRKTVVAEWLPKLPATGDARAGREIFSKNCAQCHAVGSEGNHVGPELTDVSHRSVEDLASNILDPNMAINPGFISYNVETDSGEFETGILQAQSGDAVTLLQAGGKKVLIVRKKIKRLESSGLSLMPEGLEATMTPAQLRDLIAFLQEKR